MILFTSGTSGRAKGAVLTHASIRVSAAYAAEALRLGPGDVMLGAAPFSHVLGQSTGLVSTFLGGGAVAVVPRFDGEATLQLMTETKTTILLGVPTMCIALCQAARSARELPPVRIAHVGGAPVPVEVARDFERTFGGEVYEGYGLTETSGVATTFSHGQVRKLGSVGRRSARPSSGSPRPTVHRWTRGGRRDLLSWALGHPGVLGGHGCDRGRAVAGRVAGHR